jgi:hypothetical protein
MPLGALLCPLGIKCVPPLNVRAPLCIRAMGFFKPLEAHIRFLEAHSCPSGLNYASWGSFMLPGDQVRAPPHACMPPLCVRTPSLCVHAMGSFKPLEAHICPTVVIPGVRRPSGRRTGRVGGRAALSITPYMNRAGYCRQRNYCSKFILL